MVKVIPTSITVVELRLVVVGDDQAAVEGGADPVAGELADHAVAEPAGVALDHPADHVDPAAGPDRLDAALERLAGPLDQQPRLLVDVTGEEGGVGVAVHAVEVAGDVDVDEVAVLDDAVVGDAVADDFVDAGAQALREARCSRGSTGRRRGRRGTRGRSGRARRS